MKPHDPNFPEEIPAIPDAATPNTTLEPSAIEHGAESPGQGQPTPPHENQLLGNASGSGAAGASGSESSWTTSEPEVWTEIDEAEPDDFRESPSMVRESKRERGGESDQATGGRSDSTGTTTPREAEKPGHILSPYDDWAAGEVPYQPKELGIIDKFLLLIADGATLWRRLLRWVRSLLPADLQRQLGDELLTAILLGLLMLFLAVWHPIGKRSVSPVASNAEPPSFSEVEAEGQTGGPGESAPRDVAASPKGSPDLKAEPPTEPSPEQNLIAEIQTQVSQISRSYAAGLIQSVEVNLPENKLVINVGADWYGLVTAQQDVVAQDIYDRAQGLAFNTLNLRDPEGVVVARNPVVGSRMVVLKRSRSADTDLLVS